MVIEKREKEEGQTFPPFFQGSPFPPKKRLRQISHTILYFVRIYSFGSKSRVLSGDVGGLLLGIYAEIDV